MRGRWRGEQGATREGSGCGGRGVVKHAFEAEVVADEEASGGHRVGR